MTAARPAELLRLVDQDTPDDAELFARFRRGDPGAFATLVRRHGPLVLAVCRRIANQDADDAFQATFLTLVRKAGSIREPRLIGNWLYGAALRVARRANRSAARRRSREVQAVDVPEPVAPVRETPFEDGRAVREELAKLPEPIREAIVLCELRGVPRAEAAAILRIPEGTLSSRLARGRKLLAERLSQRGITLGSALITVATVPEALVAATCRIAAGSAVPAAIERLMGGGFTMRTVLIGVLGFGLAAAGAVIAARPEEQPPMAKAPPAAPEPKAAEKPEPKAEVVVKPRLVKTLDLQVKANRLIWSPDGKWFVVDSGGTERTDQIVFMSQVTPARGEMPFSGRLIGITPDSKHIVTDLRESGLLSGLHAVRLWHVIGDRAGPMGGPMGGAGGFGVRFEQSKEHVLDPESERQYGFPAGGEAIRTLNITQPTPGGAITRVEVFETKLGEAAAKSVFKSDTECESVVLSRSGNKIALLNKMSVAVHDIAAGKRTTFEKLPAADPPLKENDARTRVARFSPDESLIITSLVGRSPVILSLSGDKPVALEGTDTLSMYVHEGSFSPNNRLVAIRGVRYGKVEGKGPLGGMPKGSGLGMVGSPLIVWDVKTGKIVKAWEQYDVKAVFHPQKPTLAIFEPNGNGTRIGFWDFVE